MPSITRGRPWRPRSVSTVVMVVALAWLVGDEINAVWGPGPRDSVVFGRVAYETVLQLAGLACILRGFHVAGERAAWMLIGLSFMVWGWGDIYFQLELAQREEIPVPSLADAGFIAFYPLLFAGMVLLFRARSGRTSGAQWLDSLTAALAAAALSAALGLQAVLDSVGGETLAVATNLAYPIGDLLILGVIVGALVVCGWRGASVWLWSAAGVVAFCVADGGYLIASAAGTYEVGAWFDIGWVAGPVLVAIGAWSDRPMPVARRSRPNALAQIGLPLSFAVVSIGLLLLTGSAEINMVARSLAAASLLVVVVRLATTFRAHSRVLAEREEQATTDDLTGLANRRALNADLVEAIADAVESGVPKLVAIYDLDGFKHYNDTFGHHAGDALLVRLGAKLNESVGDHARAYRLGGDEFCVLAAPGADGSDDAVHRAAAALVEVGDGFVIRSSYGVAHIPFEASEADAALRLADQRMYDQKGLGRASAKRQSRDVLLQALREHNPELGDHTRGVRDLAEGVGKRLGLSITDIEAVGDTADLHDVGKVAIPRAILDKPGPLDDEEWAFMRRHTLIGERIVAAAPALQEVAVAVRATHERWDGAGYPDGLAGESIPLAARIVAVCDAFDAMIADRPYASARTADEAVAELHRCSGTQFDPRVVVVFASVVDERRSIDGLVRA